MRVEESIQIARPPENVWAVIADPRNDPDWCHKVQSVEQIGEGRWRVVHKPVPLRPPMELSLERIDAQPPVAMKLREEDEASVFEVEYRLEPTDAGTRFTQVSEIRWKKLPRILHGTFRRGVQRDIRGQLEALKARVEG